MHKNIKLSFHQKSPSSSVYESQLRVQRSKKKFPLAVGLKQETTQKPSAGGGPEFPVPQDQVDIFTGSTSRCSHICPPSYALKWRLHELTSCLFHLLMKPKHLCLAQIWPLRAFVERVNESSHIPPQLLGACVPTNRHGALALDDLGKPSTETPVVRSGFHRAGEVPNIWAAQV